MKKFCAVIGVTRREILPLLKGEEKSTDTAKIADYNRANEDLYAMLYLLVELPEVFCVQKYRECFNDWGGNTTLLSPGRSTKQPLPVIGLHDPLHYRQACPECRSFNQGVDQISPREGLFSYRPLVKRGQSCDVPAPPPNR